MRRLVLDNTDIDDSTDCYVIAEVGHNHGGDLETCKAMFRAAKEAGAHAVKLQKRDNRTLYTRETYEKPYENENSYGPTYGLHREALEFGKPEYTELQRYCKELGISFFSTAFDIPSADFLEELDTPAYKIASGDVKTIPLLQHVARFGKPVILSTGGAAVEDVRRAADAILAINRRLCILQCTAGYPARFEELDLRVIETFRREFPDTVIGLSSHDNGIAMAVAAYVLGARVVEKHFTLNRAMKGTDHAFSLEPQGLRKMVRDLGRARVAMGDGVKRVHPREGAPILKMGKKLVAARDLDAGTVLRPEHIAMKCPGDGLSPRFFEGLLGRTLKKPVREDENLSFELVEPGESVLQ